MLTITTDADLFDLTTPAEKHAWLLDQPSAKRAARQMRVNLKALHFDIDPTAPPALAYVNHGRWVADCPSEGCAGATSIMPGAGFLCAECLNAEVGHRYRPVAWPAERAAVEDALCCRRLPQTANWRPGETVRALEDENVRHGLPRRGSLGMAAAEPAPEPVPSRRVRALPAAPPVGEA